MATAAASKPAFNAKPAVLAKTKKSTSKINTTTTAHKSHATTAPATSTSSLTYGVTLHLTFRLHRKPIRCVVAHPTDAALILTAAEDGLIAILDIHNGKLIKVLGIHTFFIFRLHLWCDCSVVMFLFCYTVLCYILFIVCYR